MTDEMNRKNKELDHIRPLSSFDLTIIDQLKEAAHYTNIQPFIAKDNRSKDIDITSTIYGCNQKNSIIMKYISIIFIC